MWSQTKRTWRNWSFITGCMLVSACADSPNDAMTEPQVMEPGEVATAAALTGVGYTPVIGDDWSTYSTKADLRAADLFWWWRTGDPVDQVDVVSDPTFGKALRVTFAQSTEYDYVPKLSKDLPTPLDKMWYRFRVKWQPGFTTVGPSPAGWANSYKLAFWLWEGADSRGQIEFSNTNEYIIGASVNMNGTYQNYNETILPGSVDWGRTSTEWTDNQWWEYVAYWEKTGATSARQHIWKRRLTNGGTIANNQWTYWGVQMSGAPTPRVRSIQLGGNKNKNNPTTMYMYLGRWEVVDGSKYPNPFGMPNLGTTPPPTPTPTLTGVSITPDSAVVQAGRTVQFQSTGRMSDGSNSAVTVTYSANSGSVNASGLYTAPATAGTYQVIARHQSGLADTARVRVTTAATAPTLASVRITPDSAVVQTGGSVQFSTSGRMSDGSNTTVTVAYTASAGSVSSSGQYTAPASAGNYQVIARHQSGLADTARVRVTTTQTGPTLSGVRLTPYRVTVAPGAKTQFQAVGLMSNNTTSAVTATYSTNGGTITSAGSHTAPAAAGTYHVIASSGSFADTSTVIVSGSTTPTPTPTPTLTGVRLTPYRVTVAPGAATQFQAVGLTSNGTTTAVTVTYSTNGGSITNAGRHTAPAVAGTYRVIAASGSFADTSTVIVSGSTAPTPTPTPTLNAVRLTPYRVTVAPGAATQFQAVGLMSDGSSSAVTATYSTNGGSITSAGRHTAPAAAGTYRVIAISGSRADTSTVIVR